MSYRTLAASRDHLTPTTNHAPVARSSALYLPSDVLSLQRTIGNRAVEALLQGSDPASQPRHEPALPAVHHVVGALGRPLDEATRTFYEARLGHDLSSVRVHTDAEAAESVRAVNALAYTVGPHIVFSSGQYAPATTAGRRVLAHELAHVLQQRDWRSQPRPQLGATTDEWERRAEAAASAVERGEQVPHDGAPGGAPPLLQRQASTIPVRGDIGDVVERALGFARVPLLPNAVLAAAEGHLQAGRWQEAVDVIVDELVDAGEIDRRLLKAGRVHYDPHEAQTGASYFPGGLRRRGTALPTRVRVGKPAFKNVSWLLSTILHEYKHVLQYQSPRRLPTIGSAVPGQYPTPAHNVEASGEELFRAQETGVARHPAEIRELWWVVHNASWQHLSHAEKVRLNNLYRRAHEAAEAALGHSGPPLPFSPLPLP